MDKSCPSCNHFGFCDPEPPYGFTSNWFCKLHKKRITGKGCEGKDWVNSYKKTMAKKG